jgi:hypothetical protein
MLEGAVMAAMVVANADVAGLCLLTGRAVGRGWGGSVGQSSLPKVGVRSCFEVFYLPSNDTYNLVLYCRLRQDG